MRNQVQHNESALSLVDWHTIDTFSNEYNFLPQRFMIRTLKNRKSSERSELTAWKQARGVEEADEKFSFVLIAIWRISSFRGH